jgi:hypothetical protein
MHWNNVVGWRSMKLNVSANRFFEQRESLPLRMPGGHRGKRIGEVLHQIEDHSSTILPVSTRSCQIGRERPKEFFKSSRAPMPHSLSGPVRPCRTPPRRGMHRTGQRVEV